MKSRAANRVAQPLSTVASGTVQWTHRYTSYARSHGLTPEQMIAQDADRYPGGRMAGFIIWIGQQWDAWEKATGRPSRHRVALTLPEHQAFDEWLAGRREAA
jgi:hypothetical protein